MTQADANLDTCDFDPDLHLYRNPRGEIVPSVTGTLKSCFDYSRVNPDVMEAKRLIGDAVHRWTAEHDRGKKPDLLELSEIEEGYARAWLVCRIEHPMEFLEIEQPMVRTLMGVEVGGTPDRIVRIGGRLFILDIKCVANLHPAWRLQLAQYGMMYRQRPNLSGIGRVIVRLKPNAHYHWDVINAKHDTADAAVAIAFLQTTTWMLNNRLKV